jgi:Holliday junction resolvase
MDNDEPLDENLFNIDKDIFKEKKKRLNSGAKGKRAERDICKTLTERFGKEFSRSLGSGNRWGQVSNMPKHAKETFGGDICCPEDFKWVIESKNGYEDKIDLNSFDSGITKLDEFIEQSTKDSELTGRESLIFWKRKRKNWLCFIKTKHLPDPDIYNYRIVYREWSCISFTELLELPDEFFF